MRAEVYVYKHKMRLAIDAKATLNDQSTTISPNMIYKYY